MRRRSGYPVWLFLSQHGHCLVRTPAARRPRPRHTLRGIAGFVVAFAIATVAGCQVGQWWQS